MERKIYRTQEMNRKKGGISKCWYNTTNEEKV